MDEDDFERELYQLAIHESGHVVVAWALGYDIENVSIVGDDEYRGRTLIIPPARETSCGSLEPVIQRCRSLEKRVRICFAGPLAEGRFAGERLHQIAAHNDFKQGIILLRSVAETHIERERIGDFLFRKTQALVGRRWHEINSLARNLVANGELFWEDVDAILGPRRLEYFSRKSAISEATLDS